MTGPKTILSALSFATLASLSPAKDTAAPTSTKPPAPVLPLFDETPKTIVVNGYSTSRLWPALLQEKLDEHTGGKRILSVKSAIKGGTPVAKWIDTQSGEPLQPWLNTLRPALKDVPPDHPVIVLAQQSLQWTFGDRQTGIADKSDTARIKQGADALEKYAKLLKADGADLVFIATHIYKHPMEPEIGNERLALAELISRNLPNVHPGPDVWIPTKDQYPAAFAQDRLHPNDLGAQIMADHWFQTLLDYDQAQAQ
ncbi:MAG: hypothetical protein AAF591_05105 [Verrucomicrobiota bacterium]